MYSTWWGNKAGIATQKKVGTVPAAGAEEEKQSNEIKFAIPTLQQLDIARRTITADAMHTQRKAAQYIVCEGGHYHFTVKANQPNLLQSIEYEFESSNREPDLSVTWKKTMDASSKDASGYPID